MICVPNATFHIDCNRCQCSPTGMSIDCTDWYCTTLTIPHDIFLNVSLNCWRGEIFLYNHYKCLCAKEGNYATCSSAHYELAHNLRPASGSIISLAESVASCTPGLVFKNECDTCICSESGEAACLGIGCISANGLLEANHNTPVNSTEKLCIPYSTFSLDCNQCICSSDGFSLSCDPYPCLGVELRDDQLLNITFFCVPGAAFLYNRHECLCARSGRRALCSPAPTDRSREFRASGRLVFSIAESAELCTPGMTFKDRCNVCICGAAERAACTRVDCDLGWRRPDDDEPRPLGRIVAKEDVWVRRGKSKRFCRRNYAHMYCRYLREFWKNQE